MSAAKLYCCVLSNCWSNHSLGQTFLGMLSSFKHRLSGTRCHSDSLSVFKSRFKTFLLILAFTEHWSDLLPTNFWS